MKNRLILISVFYLNLLVFVFVVSFFFECPIYNMCRIEMEKNPMRIIYIPVTLIFLLNGSNTLTHEENIDIILNVQGIFLKRKVSFDSKCIFQFANTYC